MTPSQIITQDAKNNNVNPQQVLQTTLAQIKSGMSILLHQNNSVLTVTRLGNGKAMLHLFTLDPPLTLRHSLSNFIKQIKSSEIKVVYGDTMNQQLLALLKKVGVDVQKSNLPKFTWMAEVK